MLSVRWIAHSVMLAASGPDQLPQPTFSPASLQFTPAAAARLSKSASPGHRWDRPQPPAMVRECLAALEFRPPARASGDSPSAARASLMYSRTLARTASCTDVVRVCRGAGVAGAGERDGVAVGVGVPAGVGWAEGVGAA